MADGGSYGRKTCRSCAGDMSVRDLHADCLQCLSISHSSTHCKVCKGFTFAIISCRLGIVGDALQENKWSINWRLKLAETENVVWSLPSHHSPPSSQDEEDVSMHTEKTYLKQPSTSITDLEWRTGVENTITALGDSIRIMSESL